MLVFFFSLLTIFHPFDLCANLWTGQGNSTSWNDPGNWESGEVPVPSVSTTFIFESPAGNKFGFGGTNPFGAGALIVSENAGQFSFTAPGIVLGGSAADDKVDGFILEDLFFNGSVVNQSKQALILGADVRLGWDTVINASNANVAISGSLDGTGRKLVKEGPADLLISNGQVTLSALDIKNGRVALVGSNATIQDSFGKSRKGELMLLNGSVLTTASSGTGKSISLFPTISMSGVNKTTGAPCKWDLSGDSLTLYGYPFTLSLGASITNTGALTIMMPPGETNRLNYSLAGGASISCTGLTIGSTEARYYQSASNITFTLMGTPLTEKRQTMLNLNGGNINVGLRIDGNARSRHNSLIVKDNARILNANLLTVPAGNGDSFNSAVFRDGAFLSCTGMSIGYLSVSNRVEVVGATTQVSVGGGDVRIGHTQYWGGTRDNGLSIREGATVSQVGKIVIGQGRSNKNENDSGNFLSLQSGARLESQSAIVSHAGSREGVSTNNYIRVEGVGTKWNASGGNIGVGYAESGNSHGNYILITDSALVTNAGPVSVGVASGRTSRGNRLILTNNAKIFSTALVQVGVNNNSNKNNESSDNSILVTGGESGTSLWDLGGAGLYIGSASGWNANSRDNKFILGPGSQIKNVGSLVIGRGEGNFKNNALVLAGGALTAKSLTITELNGIEVTLTSAGIKPLLIETDVTFDYDTTIFPKASPDAKSGSYPLLGWKGKSKNLDKLKLAKSVDKNKWYLEVQEDSKRMYLNYKAN